MESDREASADLVAVPTERRRATRALILGAVLGAVLAMLGARSSRL